MIEWGSPGEGWLVNLTSTLLPKQSYTEWRGVQKGREDLENQAGVQPAWGLCPRR